MRVRAQDHLQEIREAVAIAVCFVAAVDVPVQPPGVGVRVIGRVVRIRTEVMLDGVAPTISIGVSGIGVLRHMEVLMCTVGFMAMLLGVLRVRVM